MRFLVDECTGPAVARWLRGQGFEVFSVWGQAGGSNDEDIVKKAFEEDWILITNDKDFGTLIYRKRRPHRGVVLLRLEDERLFNKIETLQRLLSHHAHRLKDQFVVVTEKGVRFARD
jgi:predicted nuclease of predicted toxin-antitoxin system